MSNEGRAVFYEKFYDRIWKQFREAKRDSLGAYYLKAIAGCLKMYPKLSDADVIKILEDLQEELEKTETPSVMMSLIESIVIISEWKPKIFELKFQDIVDILVGWHIDSSQKASVRLFTSQALLKWHTFWIIDLEFSSGLLKQFIEDVESFQEDVASAKTTLEVKDCAQHIQAVIQVFNTVLSCLRSTKSRQSVSFLPPESRSWFMIVFKCLTSALDKQFDEDILISGQQSFIMLLERIDSIYTKNHDEIVDYLKRSVVNFGLCSRKGQVENLKFIRKLYEKFSNDLLDFYLKSDIFKFAAANGFKDVKLRKEAIKFYHQLLDTKNIHSLQEVYSHLTSNYKKAVAGPGNEDSLFFVLDCLSNLIRAKGSVLSMWALDPSIFGLLNDQSSLKDIKFIKERPNVHYALVKTLVFHCDLHKQFATSSNLVANGGQSRPSATYFESAVVTCGKLLKMRSNLPDSTVILTLNWSENVLEEVSLCPAFLAHESVRQIFAEILNMFKNFEQLGNLLQNVMEKVSWILGKFNYQSLGVQVYQRIQAISVLQLKSTDLKIRELAREIISNLPPMIGSFGESKNASLQPLSSQKLLLLQNPHLQSTLANTDFSVFMDGLLKGPFKADSLRVDGHLERNVGPHKILSETTLLNEDYRSFWIGYHVAQFCVNNKLKTPLGKPQDTLTTIEKVLRNIAQTLNNNETQKIDFKQCTNLLVFYEMLEKSMHNAWDGSAYHWNSVSAPITSFFTANKKTCVDWLSRLRITIVQLSFHLGHYAFCLRNAFEALNQIVKRSTQDDSQLALLVVLAALSLTKLHGAQGLSGLYSWCKERTGKKYRWISGLIGIVKSKLEDGLKNLEAHLPQIFEIDQSIAGFFCREIFLTKGVICDQSGYETMVQTYKDQWPKESEPYTKKYLDALSSFANGDLPTTYKDADFEFKCGGSIEKIHHCHQCLLKIGTYFQPSGGGVIVKNNIRTSAEVKDVAEKLDEILDSHFLIDAQRRQVITLKMVQTEFSALIEDPYNLKNSKLNVLVSHESGKSQPDQIGSMILIKKWSDFLSKLRGNMFQSELQNLNLEIAIVARKTKNYATASKHLQSALWGQDPNQLIEVKSYLRQMNFNAAILNIERASCLRQAAKLVHAMGDDKEDLALYTMSGLVSNILTMDSYGIQTTEELRCISARALNNLTSWLKADPAKVTLVGQLLEHEAHSISDILEPFAGDEPELAVGRLLRLAVIQAPLLAKSWQKLANWSLEMGEKILLSLDNMFELTPQEKLTLDSILNQSLDQDEVDDLCKLMTKVKIGKSDTDIDQEDVMQKALNECGFMAKVEDFHLVVSLWKQVRARGFSFHQTAVNAYCQFLSKCSGDGEMENIISATLKVTHMTVKYVFDLQQTLEKGLDSIPTRHWRKIIPQLFSRLNHPVKVVRDRISELLCKIATEYPHLIIYPAVVGSMSSSKDKFSKFLTLNDDGNEEDEEKDPELQSAHARIVEFMAKRSPDSIGQVQKVVYELLRISLLWDELWLGTMQQYSNEINRRVKRMEEDVQKLKDNDRLSAEEKDKLVKEKYNIWFKPMLFILERVAAVTSNKPETHHEQWFNKKYGDFITSAMAKLKEPADPSKPKETWGILHQFQTNLAQKVQKKNQLKMSEISGVLHTMKRTSVPLPGFLGDLCIESFHNALTILPTKTKPKRIGIYGSDGKKYFYLFKGLEDMHLDERIMQFLDIANTLMRKTGSEYSARHYSVVPLGPRSGLIKWVEGAIPLYSLYKRWQQRQQMNDQAAKKSATNSTAYSKPSDSFYGKLIPLLREHGITNLDNRKEWPLPVMKQVLQELIDETPSNLLSQEIWFASTDSSHWYQLTSNLTRSFAVMSVIGYIIGLGDRHLDNLLIDLQTGEVIHIDYNVCFEKGKNLRIPERVPCRLTQNIVNVFGLTGVDGVFRLSCEHTLESMRGGKETLMTLLEAFVYDPLVDWTPGVDLRLPGANHHGGAVDALQDKRDMQTELTFSMLAVRVAEIKSRWLENQTQMLNSFCSVEDNFNFWIELSHNSQQLNEYMSKLHLGMSSLKEAEANPSHRLYMLQNRFVEHNMVEAAVKVAQTKIAAFIEENEKWTHLHQRAESCLTPDQIAKWTSEVSDIRVLSAKANGMVRGFLDNAGQSSLLSQIQTAETAFCEGIEKFRQDLQTCVLLVGHYSTMYGLYPLSHKADLRTSRYIRWMRQIADDFSLETCQSVHQEFTSVYEDLSSDAARLKQHHVVNIHYQMENWNQQINMRLQNIYERMIEEQIESQNVILSFITKSILNIQQVLKDDATEATVFDGLLLSKFGEIATDILALETKACLNGPEGFIDLSNGDWFLFDEILMKIGFCGQFLDFLDFLGTFPVSDDRVAKCFSSSQNVIKQLQHLNNSFFAVIFQESLKCFQREEPSGRSFFFQKRPQRINMGLALQRLQ